MKIGRLHIFLKDRRLREIEELNFDDVDERYEAGLRSGKKLVLGTLISRSGTRWLCDIFSAHKNATGAVDRDIGAESFYRFIKYNDLPIDTIGVIRLLKARILDDWEHADIALVCSPQFSYGFNELYDTLHPHEVLFAITDPRFNVQSLYNKGYFSEDLIRGDLEKTLGYQPALDQQWSHYFGRIVPNGEYYKTWERLTRLGKISWLGNQIIRDMYEQFKGIPKEKWYIFNLKEADQNYEWYKTMATHFGLTPQLDKKTFLSIKAKTVKNSDNETHEWSAQEEREFLKLTEDWFRIYGQFCQND